MSVVDQPIVILISGSGSNMAALVEAARQRRWAQRWGAQVVAVISNRPEAAGLAWARAQGLATAVVDHREHDGREAFDAALMQAIDAQVAKLVMLDHHKSAADKLGRFQCRCGAVHFDMSQSGAMLSWKFFFPEQPVPDLIRYVQDRDLWHWAFPESAPFLSALDLEPNEFPRWAEIAAFTPEQVAEFGQRGSAMNEKFLSLCRDIAQGAAPITFNGQAGVMVNCPGAFTSEVGNMLSAECGSFALLWSVSKDGTVKVGLRAVPTFNAIPLAESMGGGGHPQACGFRMGPERLVELLTGVFWADSDQTVTL